jgi:2-dehydro-3-deoxygluconokinase
VTRSGPDVLTFGETMAVVRALSPGPLRHNAQLALSCAGAESTVAIGLARLGHRAVWAGRVGADELGELVADTVRGAGVEVHAITDPERPTGLLVRSPRTPAVTRVAYYRAGSAGSALSLQDLLPVLAARPAIVHVSGITPALSPSACEAVSGALSQARQDGSLISYDVNFRSRLTTVAEAAALLRGLLPVIDILFAGEDELPVLLTALDSAGASTAALSGGVVPQLVVKRGRQGATAYADGSEVAVPAVATTTADPVGAGDSFVAGYLSGVLDGLDVRGRLARGA